MEACFDQIDHEWILNNILIDGKILKAWLNSGYMERGKFYPTKAGTPQGGIISPMLANMTLDGLESAAKKAVPKNPVRCETPAHWESGCGRCEG